MNTFRNILFSFLIAFSATAQNGETILEKSNILVGQQVMLTYHVSLSEKNKIDFHPFQSKIPIKRTNSSKGDKKNGELEIIKPFSDTLIKHKGKFEWFGSYTITAWDSGTFIIPSSTIHILGKAITLPASHIQVDLVPAKKGQDIYDIEESFAQIPDEPILEKIKQFHKNYWPWIYSVLVLVLLYLGYRKWNKNKNKPVEKQVESLEKLTIKEIDALEQKRLWTEGKLKEHYVELSFILRSYLSKRFEINLLEKTSLESKILLIQKGLRKDTVENIGEILDQADMVKFAKSTTEEITVLRLSVLAKQIVNETSPKEIEHV